MDSVYTAVLCGCVTALALTLAEGILPMERFAKQIRLLFSLLMLIALLGPLTKLELLTNIPEPAAAEQYSEEIAALADSARVSAVKESVLHALENAIAEHKVPCTVKEISLHISDNSSIMIDEVQITGNLLTGAVYLHEWLGDSVLITEWKEGDAVD